MKKSTVFFILSALLVLALNAASQVSPPIHYLDPYNPQYADGVVLVKMHDESGIRSYADFIASAAYQMISQNFSVEKTTHLFPRAPKPDPRTINTFSGQLIELHDLATIFKLKLAPGTDAEAAAETIAAYPDIEFAEPDYLIYTMLEPDDPLSGDQWHLAAFPGVNAEAAWDSTTGDTLQIIGIIDTGVDWDHPDLADKIWLNYAEYNGAAGVDDDGNGFTDDIRGWDWINQDNDPNDDNCHGTHVAGIAAAESNNGIGVAGISWGAKIMPLKVLQSSGYGTMSDVALAAEYAYENSATVINMSLGSYGESMTLKTTLENAYAYCALVAAAGNDGKPIEIFPMFPACYSFVLGTEASTNTGSKASFSNFDPSGPLTCGNSYGYNYEMKAPGVSIMSTFPNGGYDELNGTSMASPMVAGAVALIKTIDPDIQNTTLFANLIYSANNGILDIANALEYELGEPDLHFVDYAMVDTLGGGDNDGRADAGEMIEIWLTVKNTAGWADSVWSKIRFGQFEDTTVANIIDSTSYIGDISTFATYTGEPDPIVIQISPDVANYRDIVFEYEIGAANWGETIEGTIILKAYNTVELGGLFNSDTTLTADYEYWMTENLRVMPGCTLTLNPGVHIVMMGNKTLDVAGILIANGTPDSMVDFSSSGNNSDLILESTSTCILNYTIFNGINNGQIITCAFSNIIFNNVVFKDCSNLFDFSNPSMGSLITNCSNIINCVGVRTVECSQIINCNIINNYGYNNFVYCYGYNSLIDSSCFFNNQSYSIAAPYWLSFNISNNYWGTTDTSLIHEEEIWDFYDDGSLAVAVLSPVLEQPPAENHGIVWKVEINGQNPQYAAIDPLGCETVQFDAYFNRAMDIEETPFLTFGVCEPFTQHVIDDSASWSADSTIYTAYYTVGLETGDGINTVRVANAKDTDHFEIPVEYTRFKFNIQAAAGASVNFMATPGIGKVELEWPQAPSPDLLGYNMYRFNQINDTTYTDTGFINSSLITDTLYTDFDVLPDCTYFYLYTVISTDMDESNYSNSVPATPFSAPTGDANGDMSVNVLDIISIVAYITGGDPQPFLFDAADVNLDQVINVLDIVGVVNIIMGNTIQDAGVALTEALITQYEDNARLTIDGDVAGLQYKVSAANLSGLTLHPFEGMEMVTHETDAGEILVLVYSFTNNSIPPGEYPLASYTAGSEVVFSDGLACDPSANGINIAVVLGQDGLLPTAYRLYQNYPNPFNPNTIIPYDLPENSKVAIKIFNILGQEVYRWNFHAQPPGKYQVVWNGTDKQGIPVSSGLYFVKMKADKYISSKKMILLK